MLSWLFRQPLITLCSAAGLSQCQVLSASQQTQRDPSECEAPLALPPQHVSWPVLQVPTAPCSCFSHSTSRRFPVDSTHAMCAERQPTALLFLPFRNRSLRWKQPASSSSSHKNNVTGTHLNIRDSQGYTLRCCVMLCYVPYCQWYCSRPFRLIHIGWWTSEYPWECRKRCCRAKSHQPNPIQCLASLRNPSLHTQLSLWQSTKTPTLYTYNERKAVTEPQEHVHLIDTHQLCYKKSNDKKQTRAFNVRPAPRACHKDECLTYNAHLEINSRRELAVVIPDGSHSEFVLPLVFFFFFFFFFCVGYFFFNFFFFFLKKL